VRILGVDPGSQATGWAVIDSSGSGVLIAAGVIRVRPTLPFPERLLELHRQMTAVIEREHPSEAAIERVFSGVNPQSLITLGQARGVLLLALAEAGLGVGEFSPNQIKRTIAGAGRASKEQVRLMVLARLRFAGPARNLALDATDAAAVGMTALILAQFPGRELLTPPPPDQKDPVPGSPPHWKRRPAG
jgi:crossover junction endodeoxyribonuclease RuvC